MGGFSIGFEKGDQERNVIQITVLFFKSGFVCKNPVFIRELK